MEADPLFSDDQLPVPAREVMPGVVHLPGWLSHDQQRFLVRRFAEWGADPQGIPPHHPEVFGHPMSVRLTSLGWHWDNDRYTRTADEFGGAHALPIPDWMIRLGRHAVAEAFAPEVARSWPERMGAAERAEWAASYTPDVALVNYYAPHASMGMHQDKVERCDMPIVSLSIGDTAVFRAGNTVSATQPYTDVLLASGDLIVFGGPSRFMYHGVPKILPRTGPTEVGVERGRFNLTLRQTGLK